LGRGQTGSLVARSLDAIRSTSNCLHNVLKSKKVSVITAERENIESDKEEMVKHNHGL
jgi:hypothetical protein